MLFVLAFGAAGAAAPVRQVQWQWSESPSVRVGVPEANQPAVEAMTARAYEEVAGTQRMRLGPEVRWRPDLVFGVFNPFWG